MKPMRYGWVCKELAVKEGKFNTLEFNERGFCFKYFLPLKKYLSSAIVKVH
jgi:hypothetical protein